MVRAAGARPRGAHLSIPPDHAHDGLGVLRGILGAGRVLTDPDVRSPHETDWTTQFKGVARAVVRPATTAEVAGVVGFCDGAGIPVVTQGGNTGLVGGSVPDGSGSAVVLDTRRLDRLGPVNREAAQATFGAGVPLAVAQHHARAAGFDIGVDIAARDSATLGGMAATNAGGVHVLRHGAMRRQLVGFEAVLADGTVLSHLGGMEKDNTGYDLGGLLCGSEGTLAVFTHLRVRLVPRLPHRVTALLAWADLVTMVEGLAGLRAGIAGLEAAEYMVRAGIELVRSSFGGADPFPRPHPAYLLIEAAGATDPTPELAGAVHRLAGVRDVAVSAGGRSREALWRLRELHTPALAAAGPPRKYDVAVPVGNLAAFAGEVTALVESRPGLSCHHFGHLADGNMHLNVIGCTHLPPPEIERLDGDVLGLVARHGGTISAEHGIGRLKQPWLHLSRSAAEIATFRTLKAALDPRGTLNPGVLLAGR